jgi:protein SCO1/2
METSHPAPPRPSLQPWLWTGFIALIMAVPLLRQQMEPPLPPPPILGTVPAFRLVDQTGAVFGPERLAGRVWVASFIFTRCPSICPEMTGRLLRLQPQLGEAVELVSVSVDPDYDTPERMRAFAEHHRANSPRWHFLTGDGHEIRERVIPGFKVTLAREGDDFLSIVHSVRVVLVDGQGRIRGYYDSSDTDALDRLVRDARQLTARPNV